MARLGYNGIMKTKSISANARFETYAPRIIAISLLALLLLALTGCKHETTTTAEINPAGVYTLVSVDGQNVPCNLTHEGVTMTVKSGVFTINADGTCVSLMTFFVSPHPDARREVKANYTQQGTELTMHWQGAGMTKGQINGNEFAMNNEGMVFVYRK
jgi:hypothetical protein